MQLVMGRNRRRVSKEERQAPTEETRAKLTPDPLFELLAGQDASLEMAADEIRQVYTALVRKLFAKGMSFGQRIPGEGELTDEMAEAHARRYRPWVAYHGRYVIDWTLDVVVDRNKPLSWQCDSILRALADYARRMR